MIDSATFVTSIRGSYVSSGVSGEFDYAQTKITSAVILMTDLPTVEPSTTGQLWNNSGTVKVH